MYWPQSITGFSSEYLHAGNITYIDYATLQKVFLCDVPGCRHNDSSCTSYWEFSCGGYLFTNATQDKLFLLSSGSRGNDVREEELGAIWMAEIDGKNRKEICRLNANELFYGPLVVAAGEKDLYFAVLCYSDAKSEPAFNIEHLNTETCERDTLVSLTSNYFFESAYGSKLVLSTYYTDPDMCYTLDVNTGEMKAICPCNGVPLFAGEYLFRVEDDSEHEGKKCLVRYSVEDGSTARLGGLPGKAETFLGIGADPFDYYNGSFTWAYLDLQENKRIHIGDIENGTLVEGTDWLTSDGGQIVPVGFSPQGVLMRLRAERRDVTITGRDGVRRTYPYDPYAIYGFMSWEDYLSGSTDWALIEDHIAD